MHTVWRGHTKDPATGRQFDQRDRVAADYAGWVKAGADRAIDPFGSRSGVMSVYGDVHLGCVMRNTEQRFFECCFGPIGRMSGRAPMEDFGRYMKDYDDRNVEVPAYYNNKCQSPDLQTRTGPFIWNFLEMHFDPRGPDPAIALRIRNLIDSPTERPRGGGGVEERVQYGTPTYVWASRNPHDSKRGRAIHDTGRTSATRNAKSRRWKIATWRTGGHRTGNAADCPGLRRRER